MKKILTVLILSLTIVFCAVGFTACGVEFKINFIVDGKVYATVNTNGGETIKMPANPMKEDYIFDGWFWDKDVWERPFTANSLLDAPLSSDMNVYAKWKEKTIFAESISLDKNEITLNENETDYLIVTVLPETATDKSVTWKSSNDNIVIVENGKVTALRVGTAIITAQTNDGGYIIACKVIVAPVSVTSVTLNTNKLSMLLGDTDTLIATIMPKNATNTDIIWRSDNTAAVKVENGRITAVGYGKATITATAIDGDISAYCEIEVITDRIMFNTLIFDENIAYAVLPNSVTTFSFLSEITEYGNVSYAVYKEYTCETLIPSKSIPLIEGDNNVYILETVGKNITLYSITIRRRPIHTVSFNTAGGTTVASQYIEEDKFAAKPDDPTRAGYDFAGWNYNFNDPITDDTAITASWTAHSDTPYKVEYYLQNLDDDNYTLDHTDNLAGTTDTTATAIIKEIQHFTHTVITSSRESDNINGDGNTVLQVYYTRNIYPVNISAENNNITLNEYHGQYKYGYLIPDITATVSKLGYECKWYIDETLFYDNKVLPSFQVESEKNITAKLVLKAEMSNFNFTSSAIFCTIEGILNKTVTEIIVPDYVTNINLGAFSGCSNLESLTIPFVGYSKTATSASNSTLFGYIFGTTSYTNSCETKQIFYSFGIDTTWTMIYYIPSSLKTVRVTGGTIFAGSFSRCEKLENLVFGDNVSNIGECVLWRCSNIKNIIISNSVVSIKKGAFDCYSLQRVYYCGTAEEWSKILMGSYVMPYSAKRYFYSDTEPELNNDNTAYVGNYWHYDTDGVTPVIWVKEN